MKTKEIIETISVFIERFMPEEKVHYEMNEKEKEAIYCMFLRFTKAYELVNEQAKDEGLWFISETISENYLQKALRELHSMIEEGEYIPKKKIVKE